MLSGNAESRGNEVCTYNPARKRVGSGPGSSTGSTTDGHQNRDRGQEGDEVIVEHNDMEQEIIVREWDSFAFQKPYDILGVMSRCKIWPK